MRILIYGINFAPEPIGIGKYTGELAVFLGNKGHQVRVITAPPYYPMWEIKKGYSKWLPKIENIAEISVFRCPIWVPRKPSGFKRIVHLLSFAFSSFPVILWQWSWKPELLLCIAPTLFCAPSALLLARASRAKVCLHIQDFELDAALNLGLLSSHQILEKFFKISERWLLSQFDRISTISQRMLEHLIQEGISPRKVLLFPNWVDTDNIFPIINPSSSVRKDFHIPLEKIIVLYSGNMGHKQGLEIVIEAASILEDHDNIHFVLCGEGALRADLENVSKNLTNVQFLPLQPLENLNNLLNIANIHLLPQRMDAEDLVMPSKLSGMLASGKAVIATAKPGSEIAEIVGKVGIVIPPDNSKAMVEAILSLANNPNQMLKLGEKGRTWVIEHWSIKNVLNDFDDYIKDWYYSSII